VSTTIRISDAAKARIDELAAVHGLQIQALVDRAIMEYERIAFFEQVNSRFAELRADGSTWQEILAEREQMAGALADWIDADTQT
jgi:predicted transcriptional regulator